jgi:predicted Zn-dependent protease
MREALKRARKWARVASSRPVSETDMPCPPRSHDEEEAERQMSLQDIVESLSETSEVLSKADGAVDWSAGLSEIRKETVLAYSFVDETIRQDITTHAPAMYLVVSRNNENRSRSLNGGNTTWRGALQGLAWMDSHAERIVRQVEELMEAEECPSGKMDLILAPDQMVLQIHESIGHPLEMDRILGDERNYAGTTFVTPDMIGAFKYGSDELTVTFDPYGPSQAASYAYDDDGSPAYKQYLIKDGFLLRALGGHISQERSGLPGVSCSRAEGWHRPPIDRMANLNVKPGHTSLDEMVASVEQGVYMETNTSWSIDDSRNKFQFGCEYARVIRDGKLREVVRNPNYRGLSRNFWMNLKKVGTSDESRHYGVDNCGKGEPNQVMLVSHASPPCLFGDVEVFGGAAREES